jgi:putative ABC transport system permease protein
MSPTELLRSALGGIRANLTRACLTLLGVLIGVGSVILLLGVGAGAKAEVSKSIEGLGSNIVTVTPGGGSRSSTRFQNLNAKAAEALADQTQAPDIAQVVPESVSSQTVTYGTTSSTASVIGATANYFDVTASPVAVGTPFGKADDDAARKVCVLGATLALDLFGTADPVGADVIVGSTPFTVYGVLKSKDATSGGAANSGVIIPLSRMQRSISGYGALSTIVVEATGADTIDAAAAQAKAAVAGALGVSVDEASFTVTTQAQLLAATTSVSDTLSTMLAAIAAISLVVGGIGVTNIMLVTVSERTREIGIRKALGASRAAISAQFVLEATILSLLGGALGTLAAFGASQLQILGTKPVITVSSVMLAAGVSLAVGVFFGAYPAIRASMLKPVDALRHD